jgi:GNAT superfamily N-acetyltransferase
VSESCHIRTADLADAPAIARPVNVAFRPERFFIAADRTNPEKVAALMQKGKFFLLLEGEGLAGCVYAELRGERGYFGLLAVDPGRQRSGVGVRMIAAAESYCRDAGCRFMDLTFVNLRPELAAYYTQFGYVENGTLPFPADQIPHMPVHLVQLSKAL